MIPLLPTYANENSRRHYPFADDTSMKDADGQLLPADFIIDACVYPLDLQGVPYVAEINPLTRTVSLADSVTNKVFGQAVFEQDDSAVQTSANIIETSVYERQLGILVFGAGRNAVWNGRAIRQFTAEATMLTPTAFVLVNQVGVRGILLPDGTLMTGDVTIEGRDGVLVTSRIEDDQSILRVDVIGVPPVDAGDCGSTPPICTIEVQRLPGSVVMISRYDDNTLALTVPGITLDGICEQAKARRRFDPRDPCLEPPTPPTTIPPGDPVTEIFSICGSQTNTFMIIAPSAIGYQNPLAIKTNPPRVESFRGLANEPLTDIVTAGVRAEQFTNPPAIGGGISIGFQVLGQDQLPT